MSALDASNFDGLVAPSHDLTDANVSYARRHLAPLQNHSLGNAPVGVDVDALVVVAEQKLHAVAVGQGDDAVRANRSLSVLGQVDVIDGGGVEVDSVEAVGAAVDDL